MLLVDGKKWICLHFHMRHLLAAITNKAGIILPCIKTVRATSGSPKDQLMPSLACARGSRKLGAYRHPQHQVPCDGTGSSSKAE